MASSALQVDVLVLGGGAGGAAAAWQAATAGAKVLVIEETPWLGGMITSAGVSAFDGNKHAMGSGFFHRLRSAIESHYGGPEKTFTGWISLTCFEPHVAARLIGRWVAEAGAEVWHGAKLDRVVVKDSRVVAARVRYQGQTYEIRAKVFIEATEFGDVLAAGNIPCSLGRDARHITGEPSAPELGDMEVQDLTWVATLKKFPEGAPRVAKPAGYDPRVFDCCVKEYASITDESKVNHTIHTFESFLTYSLLPNDKYLLNWPHHSNDSPDTLGVFGTPAEREEALRRARHRTLCFVYFMQNELGHPEWGLATDEYDTIDGLAYMPYVRESRRGQGVRLMVEQDVVPPKGCVRAPFQSDSIAVGDYFLDHHHSKAHLPEEWRLVENYPSNGPFQIPYDCVVPRDVDGLLLAEKNISVSHIVNGCTRLQPVVMLTGQAVGMAAAMAVSQGCEVRDIDVRDLQSRLIEAGVALYPIIDVFNDHPAFKAIQHLAMRGVRFDEDPMEFKPDTKLSAEDATRLAAKIAEATGLRDAANLHREGMTRGEFYRRVYERG